jgi:hypothetical protein
VNGTRIRKLCASPISNAGVKLKPAPTILLTRKTMKNPRATHESESVSDG